MSLKFKISVDYIDDLNRAGKDETRRFLRNQELISYTTQGKLKDNQNGIDKCPACPSNESKNALLYPGTGSS